MSESAFSRCDVVAAMDDGTRGLTFFGGRERGLREAGVLRVVERTPGGQARFNNDARVLAVIGNALLDWGLQHPQRLPETERANPSRSAFWATAHALDPMTIDFIMSAARNGRDWLLRIDRITGAGGEPTFLARAFPIGGDYGETPENCMSTLSIGLRPLLAHLVEA